MKKLIKDNDILSSDIWYVMNHILLEQYLDLPEELQESFEESEIFEFADSKRDIIKGFTGIIYQILEIGALYLFVSQTK